MTIGIVDIGAGNLASVMKAVDYVGGDPVLVSAPEDILSAERLVLPGVGASMHVMNGLKERHLDAALDEAVRQKGVPMLGICVGMQLLAEDLYEFGPHKGLGWLKGKVVSLKDHGITDRPVPHMGWSDVSFSAGLGDLEKRLGRHRAFYFAHSFCAVAQDPAQICATVSYGGVEMVAGVAFDSVAAFQFHPEKSQVSGEYLLEWFLDWEP